MIIILKSTKEHKKLHINFVTLLVLRKFYKSSQPYLTHDKIFIYFPIPGNSKRCVKGNVT